MPIQLRAKGLLRDTVSGGVRILKVFELVEILTTVHAAP